jgi:hypothetical protein
MVNICLLLYGKPVRMKMEQSDWFSERSESCSLDRVTGPICFAIIINILLTELVRSG